MSEEKSEETILLEKDNDAYLPRNYLPALNLYQEGKGFTGGSLQLTKSYLIFEGRRGTNSFKIPLGKIHSYEEMKLGGIFGISVIGTSVEEPTTICLNLHSSLKDAATETRYASDTLLKSHKIKIKVKNHVAWIAKLSEVIEERLSKEGKSARDFEEKGDDISAMKVYAQLSKPAVAPEEWKELEKIDKDAEEDDYCENGVWDIDGLRDDLKLMREKLGIKVKPSPAPKAAAARKVAKKRKVRKKAKRPAAALDKSGGTSKLQELRELLEMKKEGLIDDAEFKQLKKEMLG